MKRKLIVAIDGPAGAGKSTIARIVAKRLGYLYIDTGAMYRALTWKVLQNGFNLRDSNEIAQLARKTKIQLRSEPRSNLLRVFVDGAEATNRIRTETVSRNTNIVAAIQGVRKIMRHRQREMGKKGGVVMEGRDIGTAVFPDAEAKFYLDASPAERAQRRFQELKAKGKRVVLDRISRALARRDHLDKHRGISPLKQAKDAVVIDSTNLTLEEVAQKILTQVQILTQSGRTQ